MPQDCVSANQVFGIPQLSCKHEILSYIALADESNIFKLLLLGFSFVRSDCTY